MTAKHILSISIILFCLSCKKKTEEQQPLPQAPPTAKLTFPSDKQGTTGTVLMIEGENFAEKPADNIIKVNGIQVSHVEVVELKPLIGNKTSRMLRTCIPKGAKSGEVTLTIGKNTIELGGLVIREYASNGNWKQVADFPGTPKSGITSAFVINGKAYVGLGGKATTGYYTDTYFYDFWEYDPSLDKWTKKADFPGGNRSYFVSFAIGNKGYLGLGSRDDVVGSSGDEFEKDFWEYDPAIDKWTKKKDFRERRSGGFAFSVNGRGYLLSGINVAGKSANDMWEYNPTDDSWRQRTPFPYYEALGANAVVATTTSKAYLFSGILADYYGNKYAFFQYDPQTDKWSQKAPFIGVSPVESGYTTNYWQAIAGPGFCIGSRFYLAAPIYDRFSGDLAQNFFAYDENTNQWSTMPHYFGTPQSTVGFAIGNTAYVGLGPFQKDLWKFTP